MSKKVWQTKYMSEPEMEQRVKTMLGESDE